MTRRRLWVLTTACCAILALPTVARLVALVVPADAWRTAAVTVWRTVAPRAAAATAAAIAGARGGFSMVARAIRTMAGAGLPMGLGVLALVVAVAGIVLLVVARRRGWGRGRTPRQARRLAGRLASRGRPITTIAAQTGLAQDAVRQLLRSTQTEGFADVLAASLAPTAPSPAASRSIR